MKRREFISSAAAVAAGAMLRPQWACGSTHDTWGEMDAQAASGADLASLWPSSGHLFRKNLRPGPGFSLLYEGKPAVPASVSQETSGETTFQFPSGLQVIRTVTERHGVNAIEFSLRIRNAGNQRLGVIQDIHALDIAFAEDAIAHSYVLSSGGGGYDGTYPPEAFAIRKHFFDPTLPSDGVVTLTTEGGRSSNRDLPFYFVQNDEGNAGIFVAVGWSGQWVSTISANYGSEPATPSALHLRAGIPGIEIALEPGEEIAGPSILLGAYEGSLADGSNALRRLIRSQYTPKLNGADFNVIATYDAWWNIVENYDEALMMPVAAAAASLGQEYFLLDAAWYEGSNGPEGFSGGVGNWKQVDAHKFPQGLGHFADYVRSQNLKFGLWFEPERVHRDSALAREHPDWIIWMSGSHYGLLNYGHPQVPAWVREMMDTYITQLGIEYIRHDFNIDPLAYWDSIDAPQRRGVSQIRHIQGFYGVIDWIRERHPKTVLECCASGGRRIDLETARRFHTYWISDDTIDPEVDRFHLQGIHYFLPGNYSYVQYTLPSLTQKNFKPRDLDYLDLFGGAMGLGGRVDLWPDAQKERFRTIEKLHKRLRPFLMEDYYPLTAQPLDLNGWAAWQFHNPKTGSGFVQAFRQNSAEGTKTLALRGLKADGSYHFTDPLGNTQRKLTGQEATKGIDFTLSPMSSQILEYESA